MQVIDSQNPYFAQLPLSIECFQCETANILEGLEQACAEGWSEIDYDKGRSKAEYVGLCPNCRETFEHWPTSEA